MVVVCLQSGDGGSKGHVSWLTIPHHHHHCPVAGEGHYVIPPPYPRLTASLQRSPVGWAESFRSWWSHLFRGRPGGRRHMQSGGQLSDTFTWS